MLYYVILYYNVLCYCSTKREVPPFWLTSYCGYEKHTKQGLKKTRYPYKEHKKYVSSLQI